MSNFEIKIMMSDVIFRQHMRNKNLLNCVFILTEKKENIINLFFKSNWNGAIIVLICLGFLILNDIIADYSWNEAKKTLDEIFKESE